MPAVVVRNEAGDRFDALAERIEAIAAETLPLVEAVTGLPLPDPIVIRTMTVRAWARDHRRSTKRLLFSEAEQFAPSLADVRTAALLRKGRLKTHRKLWPAIGGQAVLFEPGQPELVFLPEALRHAGRLDDTAFLNKALAHEQTHLAQYVASGGAAWAAQDTFFPVLRGVAGRAYGLLHEGHAYWADQQITTKIFGEPVTTDEASPHASARFLKVFTSPQRMAAVELYRQAVDNVARIINTEGLDAFNTVWTTPDLVPTTEEVADGLTGWPARFAGPEVTA
ncbi:zinc-dependent metalloprotease [Streptomyces hokutonensis]|uniref:zinc-dependent metalloprotease n=1 Tax=Streptomyces hokutonensis TaxID=1306990 RepID=UPI00381D7B12